MPTRFWEMASGCLLFIGFQKRKSIEQILSKIPPILVLALMVGIMYLPVSFAALSTVAIVSLSAILIGSLKKGTAAYSFFTNQKVIYLGLISYSLYLWHWGVLSISRWTIGIHWWSIPFQLALIFGLAIASYQFIETPLRKRSWFRKRWKNLTFSGMIIMIISSILILLIEPLKGRLYTGKKIEKNNIERLPRLVGGECLKNMSKNTSCVFIDNKSKQTLWILGDSHASALELAGNKVANSLKKNLKLYSTSGTAFPPVTKYRKAVKNRHLQSLEDFRLLEKKLYKLIKFGDVILLSMRMPYHFGGTYYESPASDFIFIKKDGSFGSQENYFNEWISSVLNLANIAQKKGAKIIIQTPTPEWEKEVNKLCTKNDEWFNTLQKINCQIESKFFIDEKKGLYSHLFKKLTKLSNSHENIYLFNTYKIVCPENTCKFTKDGIAIYADDDHISLEWARDKLSSKMNKFIKSIED